MKVLSRSLLGLAFLGFVSVQAFAGTCEIHFDRTACAGKEAISYKKCDGEKTCSEYVEAASAAECSAMAVKACENKRLDITKSKVVTASFDEKPLATAAGKDDFCTEYAHTDTEFNQCD